MKVNHLSLCGLLWLLLFFGCESSSEEGSRSDGDIAGEMERVDSERLSFGNIDGEFSTIDSPLRVEESDRAVAQLAVSWGEEIVTSEADWRVADENVATVTLVDGVAEVRAQGVGTTDIIAGYQDSEITLEVSVITPSGLVITGPERELKPGDQFSLGMKVQWSDESVETLSEGLLAEDISWSSSTEAASVSEMGEVSINGFGQVEIIVVAETSLGSMITGSWGVEIPCTYPEPTGRSFNTNLDLESVLPPIKWESAYSAMDGTIMPISMEEVYCSADYEWVKTINFLITAGWCTACPAHLRAVRDMSDDITEAGGLLIYVEVQDDYGDPADSAYAWDELSDLLGPTNGFFVGDKEAQPLTRFFGRSPTIRAFPDAYVVRKSDMHVITSLELNRSVGVLPLTRIAEQPDEDWSTIMPPPFESICEEGDEEASEPNDSPDTAAVIGEGTHQGGICAEGPDYYQIDLSSPWTFELAFSHSEADLDIFQYELGQTSSDPVAYSNGTTDLESISGTGPAVISVLSYSRTSTTYTISLTSE